MPSEIILFAAPVMRLIVDSIAPLQAYERFLASEHNGQSYSQASFLVCYRMKFSLSDASDANYRAVRGLPGNSNCHQ